MEKCRTCKLLFKCRIASSVITECTKYIRKLKDRICKGCGNKFENKSNIPTHCPECMEED